MLPALPWCTAAIKTQSETPDPPCIAPACLRAIPPVVPLQPSAQPLAFPVSAQFVASPSLARPPARLRLPLAAPLPFGQAP